MVVRKISAKEMLGGTSRIVSGSSPLGQQIKKYFEWQAENNAKAARAREFAAHAHGNQRYGDGPYVEHLAKVVAVLTDFGYQGDYLCAGWLHDVVEDTCTTLDDIRALQAMNVHAALGMAIYTGRLNLDELRQMIP